MESFVLIWKCT